MDDLISAINGFNASLIGAANMAMSAGTHKRDRKFNAEQAQIARDWQEEMWNKANEYNTPAMAMQRLTEAGLNPNLIYDNNTANQVAASVPSTEKASYNSGQSPRLETMAYMNQAKQLELLDAQIAKVQQEARLTSENADLTHTQNIYEDDRLNSIVTQLRNDADFSNYTYNMRLQVAHFDLDNKRIENYISNLKSQYLPQQLEVELETSYQQLNNLVAQEKFTYKQIEQLLFNERLIAQQISTLKAQATSYIASANASNAQAGLYNAQTQTENATRQGKVYMNYGTAFQNIAQAKRIVQLTPAELGKIQAETNKAYITGNMDYIRTATSAYGSGLVSSVVSTIHNIRNTDQITELLNNPTTTNLNVQLGNSGSIR